MGDEIHARGTVSLLCRDYLSPCSAEALMFPMVPTVDLHALPSFAVLCQSRNFVRNGGIFGID